MRVIEKTIFKFDELSDSAHCLGMSPRENAIQWFKDGNQYCWIDEGIDSIKAFCNHYDVKIKDYSIDPYSHSYIETDVSNCNFRGVTLKQVLKERDLMPTGYCVDCDLFYTMADVMRETGDALGAFHAAIEAGKKALINDMEWQNSDEYAIETIQANEYEFDEDGGIA
jgi:hypothetical protein